MYPMIGSAERTRSPSSTNFNRSTPWVEGCCGPMLSTMSAVSKPVPVPTMTSRLTCVVTASSCHPSHGEIQPQVLGSDLDGLDDPVVGAQSLYVHQLGRLG